MDALSYHYKEEIRTVKTKHSTQYIWTAVHHFDGHCFLDHMLENDAAE